MASLNRFARKIIKLTNVRHSSTAAQAVPVQEEILQPFRTKENNPANHNEQHFCRYYTVPEHDAKTIFVHGLPKEHLKQYKTFNEMSMLIRRPALEIINYLNQTDFSKPINKYVIYGDNGCGKTSTLCHILHYGYATRKIIVHVPWAQTWYRWPKEVAESETKEDSVDLPLDAAAWLSNFKSLNFSLLRLRDLRLSKTYEWTETDSSQKDSPLVEMIDFGINRAKYACDIVNALVYELKQASIAGKCQVLVAIDGFNVFFSDSSEVKNYKKQLMTPDKITLTEAFLDITKADWCNGQVVLTVDILATKAERDSYLPRYLLHQEGFEHLDPFLPICVENYSQDEFDTVIDYYKNRKWIRQITPEGQKEMKLITGSNPHKLMEYCKHL